VTVCVILFILIFNINMLNVNYFYEAVARRTVYNRGVTITPADPATQGAREGRGPLCLPHFFTK